MLAGWLAAGEGVRLRFCVPASLGFEGWLRLLLGPGGVGGCSSCRSWMDSSTLSDPSCTEPPWESLKSTENNLDGQHLRLALQRRINVCFLKRPRKRTNCTALSCIT